MRNTLRIILPAAFVIFAAGLAAYYHERAEDLESALATAEATASRPDPYTAAYARLASADSLLYRNRYAAAIAAYGSLLTDSTLAELEPEAEARIAHAKRLIRITEELDTLRVLAARRIGVPPPALATALPQRVRPLQLQSARPNQYDSLTFALQKARMQVRNLEGKLKRNSGGNYLTFSSRQGNEVYYVGDVRDGKANGRGVALLSSGSRYQGEWRDNMKHGVGEFHWSDGAWYEGEYVDDEREGKGTYHFPDGGVFVGEWDDDVRNGDGVFYDAEGEVVAKGLWEDDELVERG